MSQPGDVSTGVPGSADRRVPGREALPSGRVLLALLIVAGLVAGCGPGQADPDRLTAEEFVEVVVALREAERAVADDDSATARFTQRKAEILARHGTTEAELRAFLVEQGQDVAALHEVWDTIAQRLKYARGPADGAGDGAADTVAEPSGARGPDATMEGGRAIPVDTLRRRAPGPAGALPRKTIRSGGERGPSDAARDTVGGGLPSA